MKSKLFKIFLVVFMLTSGMPFVSQAEEEIQSFEAWKTENGNTPDDVKVRNAYDQYVERTQRQKQAAKDKEQREERERQAAAGFDYTVTPDQWGTNNIYQSGDVKVSQEWLKEQNQGMVGASMQQVSQIGQAAGTFTKDQKTGLYIGAATQGIASLGLLSTMGDYGKIRGQHLKAKNETEQLFRKSSEELRILNALIDKLDPKSEKAISLQQDRKRLEATVKQQEASYTQSAKAARSAWVGGAGAFVAASATGWMADQSYKMAQDFEVDPAVALANANQIFCDDGTRVEDVSKCNTPNPTPTVTPNPTPENFISDLNDQDTRDGFGNTRGLAGLETGAGTSASASSGKAPSFLGSSSSGFGSNSGLQPGSDKEGSSSGVESDLTYGAGAGGSGMSGSDPLISMDFGGGLGSGFNDNFDIGQFLPDFLQGPEGNSDFLMANVNNKEQKKKSIILEKDSPSLFTRMTKAYQKKAPQLKEELL